MRLTPDRGALFNCWVDFTSIGGESAIEFLSWIQLFVATCFPKTLRPACQGDFRPKLMANKRGVRPTLSAFMRPHYLLASPQTTLLTHINCVGDGTTPGNLPDFTQQLVQAAFVISQPYKSDQESCCEKALQNLNFPFIVNTSSSFNCKSQSHS